MSLVLLPFTFWLRHMVDDIGDLKAMTRDVCDVEAVKNFTPLYTNHNMLLCYLISNPK
jgi:hypothetical protein